MNPKGRIGQFEILERLGEGGIGQVYSAHDTMLDRQVAIKSLRPELCNDKSFVERFMAEAKNLARLSHPNITTLYSLLQDSGTIYMIMELVRGRTLEAILHERATGIPTQEALAIVGQAADGLAYAHEMGIVHRDIKPANLIVTANGLLKIMDFGIARVQGSQRMTRDGSIVGTLAYMSPEQCRGQDVDGRSDLYSLAIVLYEMLTGKAPFSAQSDYDLMQAHINQAAEPPSRSVQGIEPHIEKALLKALAKKREDRFDNVLSFKEALGAPASRTEAISLVQGVTRLLTTPLAPALPAATALATGVTEAVKKSRMSPALAGVLIGGATALLLVGILFFVTRPPAPESAPVTAEIAPPKPPAPKPIVSTATNPYFLPAQPADRAYQPAQDRTTKSSGARPTPFEPAAEPRGGSAAAPAENRGRPTESPNDRLAATEASAARPEPAAAAQNAPAVRPDPAALPTGPSTVTAEPAAPATNSSVAKAEPGPAAQDAPKISAKEVSAAYEAKDYATARKNAEICAKAGDAECEFILGRLFENGQGGEQNANIAADWYRKAAEAGHEKASFNLGALYYNGDGVAKNLATAAEWFTQAAHKHYPKAQLILGMLYLNGEGVRKDVSRAQYWYEEAAKSNDPATTEKAQQALEQIGRRRR